MVKINCNEPNKITLASYVDKALKQPLTKLRNRFRFRVTRIQPLNPRGINDKIKPSEVYIAKTNNMVDENNYNLDEATRGN